MLPRGDIKNMEVPPGSSAHTKVTPNLLQHRHNHSYSEPRLNTQNSGVHAYTAATTTHAFAAVEHPYSASKQWQNNTNSCHKDARCIWSSLHVKTLHAQACTQPGIRRRPLVMYVGDKQRENQRQRLSSC
jgi:hypothetical protein